VNRVMIDIETLGNTPGSVIVSIGAVRFDMGNGITDEFSAVIDPVDAQSRGLHLDAGTVMWWFDQSEEARAAWLAADCVKLEYALMALHDWIVREGTEKLEVWAKGASFDGLLLETAFRACGLPVPWQYWQLKCYRTVLKWWGETFAAHAGAHDALADARHQAWVLLEIEKSRLALQEVAMEGGVV
jgi:hypothetical protein